VLVSKKVLIKVNILMLILNILYMIEIDNEYTK